MKNVLQACFRLSIILTVVGFGIGFLGLDDMLLGMILLALMVIYLGWSVWTANKSSGYSQPAECFADILGDVSAYTSQMLMMFCWLVAPKFVYLPIADRHYWILTAFLGLMIFVTIVEMLITVHTCLIAMWRQNPITITH